MFASIRVTHDTSPGNGDVHTALYIRYKPFQMTDVVSAGQPARRDHR